MESLNVIKVTAAVICRGNSYLICKRLNGFWEFPGGKIEPLETPQQCLIRECREELNVTVQVGALLDVVRVPVENGRTLEIQFYSAILSEGELCARVHTEFRYVCRGELPEFSFCAADKIFVERSILGKEFAGS